MWPPLHSLFVIFFILPFHIITKRTYRRILLDVVAFILYMRPDFLFLLCYYFFPLSWTAGGIPLIFSGCGFQIGFQAAIIQGFFFG
ncbi:hypothetical protein GGI35DRAFT_440773 [Trichoderma velutinum]